MIYSTNIGSHPKKPKSDNLSKMQIMRQLLLSLWKVIICTPVIGSHPKNPKSDNLHKFQFSGVLHKDTPWNSKLALVTPWNVKICFSGVHHEIQNPLPWCKVGSIHHWTQNQLQWCKCKVGSLHHRARNPLRWCTPRKSNSSPVV